jgi:hypothetical protein
MLRLPYAYTHGLNRVSHFVAECDVRQKYTRRDKNTKIADAVDNSEDSKVVCKGLTNH